MTMASRDIANMHLFLDLKKKFPHLPDDTLRKHISLYAEDQEKCLSLLQKESVPHHPAHDFRFSETKSNCKKNENMKMLVDAHLKEKPSHLNVNSSTDLITETKSRKKMQQPLVLPATIGQSQAELSHYLGKSVNLSVPSIPEQHSAPVLANYEKPFSDIYKQMPASSHTIQCQIPIENDNSNRMMFSTTKEHTILSPVHSCSAESSVHISPSSERDKSKRHAVELSITPSFPFQQHQINVFNSAVTASASHSSRPGRHTTSLNFQLQPHSSDQYPLEISTVPSNIGDPCNYPDFGSHVQISVGSQGATFTALRLQRPYFSQNQQPNYNASYHPTEQVTQSVSKSSSHEQDSKVCMFPNKAKKESGAVPRNAFLEGSPRENRTERYPFFEEFMHYPKHNQDSPFQIQHLIGNSKPQIDLSHYFQSSPQSVEDVKSHQMACLDLVFEELEKMKTIFSKLKSEVNVLEREIMQKRKLKPSFSYAEEVEKLREENRKLRIDCKCLLMDVDQYSIGQIPLGMIDEDFYANIFTGPNGALNSPSKKGASKSSKENLQAKSKNSFDDDDEEKARWRCTKCTFANHPALVKCEMCELPKDSDSFFDVN